MQLSVQVYIKIIIGIIWSTLRMEHLMLKVKSVVVYVKNIKLGNKIELDTGLAIVKSVKLNLDDVELVVE